MSTIIDHMREFVRKTGPARKIEVDLNTLIDKALQIVGQQLKNHDLELLLQLTASLPPPSEIAHSQVR